MQKCYGWGSLTNYKVSNYHTSPPSFLHLLFTLQITKSTQVFSCLCCCSTSSLPHPYTSEIQKPQYIFVCQSFLERGSFSSQKYNRTAKWGKSANPYLCPVNSAGCAQWRHCLVTPEDPNFLQLILPCPTTCAQALLVAIEKFFSGLGNFHSSLGGTFISADLELLMTAVNREPTIIVPLLVSLPQFPLTAFASTPESQT